MDRIKIFDTTLRDGEQSPGCSMNLKEKLEVARCLERLRVDVIEAGFAISSPGDFESVSTIAREVKDCTVASLARATEKDIDCAWEAVKDAADPRIHLFIATSPLHMEYKLKMSPEQVLERAGEMVAYAAKAGADRVELYTEPYASMYPKDREAAIAPFVVAAEKAKSLGLGLNAGHDLSLENLAFMHERIPYIDEVSIGHALICDALYLGLETTIQRYLNCLK